MEALLHDIAHYVALVVEAIATLIIAIGSVEALVNIFRTLRRIADIVNTSFSPTWEEVGRLAAVAVIRTSLSYFFDREDEYTRELQRVGTLGEMS